MLCSPPALTRSYQFHRLLGCDICAPFPRSSSPGAFRAFAGSMVLMSSASRRSVRCSGVRTREAWPFASTSHDSFPNQPWHFYTKDTHGLLNKYNHGILPKPTLVSSGKYLLRIYVIMKNPTMTFCRHQPWHFRQLGKEICPTYHSALCRTIAPHTNRPTHPRQPCRRRKRHWRCRHGALERARRRTGLA